MVAGQVEREVYELEQLAEVVIVFSQQLAKK